MVAEFKEFIAKGNVMDMAVGIIIGGAFTAIVTSLVEKIINPIIAIATGGQTPGAGLQWAVGESVVDFGAFIGAIINFLIIALVVFLMVKGVNGMKRKAEELAGKTEEAEEEEAPAPTCPFCMEEVKEGATRCPHCGGAFEEPAKAAEAAE
ncbi:MAG: large conductance mechanosensitive channel protein MscL [Eggerthellaceae bacterium]|nr:large conductance mechanosensitive channel protein MscL [Eggerthellaceae bacterium]